MNRNSDVIIVGSGVSAVHAAYPLVEAGLTVTMVDVGHEDNAYEEMIPDAPYSVIRKSDPEQYRYFLGDNYEGISFEQVGGGPQITPPRKFVLWGIDELISCFSSTFFPIESLAIGGLSGVWGAVCHPYLENELRKCMLDPGEMRQHYEIIAKRIGISGNCKDLAMVYGNIDNLQPQLEIDSNAEMILSCYQKKQKNFNQAGIYVGRSLMAVLSQSINGRIPNSYHDMDFWSNKGGSVYRADWTVRELTKSQNFRLERPYLVETFTEEGQGKVKVQAKSLHHGKTVSFEARRLILAAGALGTARIVLRSLKQYDVPVPIVCNPHTYIPCVHFRGFGKFYKDNRHSLAQLVMLYDPTGDRNNLVSSQLYSYRSLLLFRLVQESPLSYRESLRIIRSLSPYLMIFVVQHQDSPGPDKYCVLRRQPDGTGDSLEIVYNLSEETQRIQGEHEKVIARNIRKLGCMPIKIVHPGHGASVHYAGQFPMTNGNKLLTTEPTGRLQSTHTVYISDGAVFPRLPAKGLTFTLMANANRIGNIVLRDFPGK